MYTYIHMLQELRDEDNDKHVARTQGALFVANQCNKVFFALNTLKHVKSLVSRIWKHCNTLQHAATHCNTHCSILQHIAMQSGAFRVQHPQHVRSLVSCTWTHCNTLQHTATHCNTLQRTAEQQSVCCSQHPQTRQVAFKSYMNTHKNIATHCDTLQHIATHCNTLQCNKVFARSVP